ncbi:phytoene/squalene synthase family protein [Muricoccus radiodurans]|uniref:phytoene/squalene synthase family protein n=1 Tax=Muricoccus radiodurans TaxID=2231721 RepID=UPI003CED9147
MAEPTGISDMAALARRHDPDRFLCALFAPAAAREAVFALIGLNHELARAREAAREPFMVLIRLQWWRDVVEEAARGAPARRHEVAGPLHAAIRAGTLDPQALLAMVEGREAEAEGPPADREAFFAALRGTAGRIAAEMGRALGAPDGFRAALETVGVAYGTAGVLRSLPVLAAQGRNPLPVAELEALGGSASGAVPLDGAGVAGLAASLAREALGRLEAARAGLRGLPRTAIAAALPGVLARRDLRRVLSDDWRPGRASGPRGIGDRLAVLGAGLAGRL